MLHTSGKILVYTSTHATELDHEKRFKIVSSVVARLAETLRLEMEIVPKNELLSIYVSYRNEQGEEIPMYLDWNKKWNERKVYNAIKSMMFVLSFHPKHSFLRVLRKDLMKLS